MKSRSIVPALVAVTIGSAGPALADRDGDGKTDLVWRHTGAPLWSNVRP